MIFPSQTSLIPVTVSLARYLSAEGISAFGQNYPYWYVGSTPFKYLTGPVVPTLLVFLQKFFNIELFNGALIAAFTAIIVGVWGWALLYKNLLGEAANKKILLVILLTYILLPWKYLSALALTEVSYALAQSLIPFCILFIYRYLLNSSYKSLIYATGLCFFTLLVNTNILTDLIISFFVLTLLKNFNEGKLKFRTNTFKNAIKPALYAFLLATVWYGPGFWWIQLTSAGIGGDIGAKVIIKIFDFFKMMLPVLVAIYIVYFHTKVKSRVELFGYVWFGSFGLLTVFRFLANPNFWMDHLTWMSQLETGFWFLGSSLYVIKNKRRFIFGGVICMFLITQIIYVRLGKPTILSKSSPAEILSLQKLSEIAGQNNVFVSGSPVFWLNAFYDTRQVRGGRDGVAVNRDWLKNSYLLRESKNPQEVNEALRLLKINYVMVHAYKSEEYYKDFTNLNIWAIVAEPVYVDLGNIIYKVNPK